MPGALARCGPGPGANGRTPGDVGRIPEDIWGRCIGTIGCGGIGFATVCAFTQSGRPSVHTSVSGSSVWSVSAEISTGAACSASATNQVAGTLDVGCACAVAFLRLKLSARASISYR